MNNFIANAFSKVMSVLHIIAIAAIVLVPMGPMVPGPSAIFMKLALLLVYVVIAGIISTLIAMNDNLHSINKKLAASPERS